MMARMPVFCRFSSKCTILILAELHELEPGQEIMPLRPTRSR
jgi:hypothetical protein